MNQINLRKLITEGIVNLSIFKVFVKSVSINKQLKTPFKYLFILDKYEYFNLIISSITFLTSFPISIMSKN